MDKSMSNNIQLRSPRAKQNLWKWKYSRSVSIHNFLTNIRQNKHCTKHELYYFPLVLHWSKKQQGWQHPLVAKHKTNNVWTHGSRLSAINRIWDKLHKSSIFFFWILFLFFQGLFNPPNPTPNFFFLGGGAVLLSPRSTLMSCTYV